MPKRDIITAIQERFNSGMITVRLNGKLLGRVYQDGPGDWRIKPEEPPQKFANLADAVEWLAKQEAPDA